MHFDLTGPCHNCPFLKEGGIRVHPARARDFAEGQLAGREGGKFPCHKTTIETEALNEEGEPEEVLGWGPQTQYCGGALAFAVQQDSYNQVMQIAVRFGWWDPQQIGPKARALVFDSVLAMVAAQTERTVPRDKRPLRKTIPKRRTF